MTSRILSLLICALFAMAASIVIPPTDPTVEAQRGGGGGGGGKGGGGKGGGGKGGGKGGGGKSGYKGKKDVNSETMQPDWKQARPATWDKAKEQNLPLVLAFIPRAEILNAKYYVGKDVAKVSRGQSIWVNILPGYKQVLRGEPGYREPEPEEEEEDSGDVDGEEEEVPEDEGDGAKKEGGDKEDPKKDAGKPAEGSDKKAQFAPADEPGKPAAGGQPAVEAPKYMKVPTSHLLVHDLWAEYQAGDTGVFILCDSQGNVFKRWDKKPIEADIVGAIEKMPKTIEKEISVLNKDLEDVKKAQEKGDTKGILKAIAVNFDRWRFGYEQTDKLAVTFNDLMTKGREQLAKFKTEANVKEMQALAKAYEGTELQAEAEAAITEAKSRK